MIGLDTNVLVRYLVQDDPAQSLQAGRTIERHCTVDDPCFVNGIVLCEIVWVLESAYDYPKAIIAEVLEKLLMTSALQIADKGVVWTALDDYRTSKADFADCLIGRTNRVWGCTETATFDKALKSLPGFKILEAATSV